LDKEETEEIRFVIVEVISYMTSTKAYQDLFRLKALFFVVLFYFD